MADWHPRWALSGGIGAGKSEVRRLLADRGVKTVDADRVGHEVLESDPAVLEAVAQEWPGVVGENGIDRKALGSIVFGDRAQLEKLEAITHPSIFGRIGSELERFDGIAVVEIPLLHHSLGEGWGRIVVDSPDESRVRRAMERGLSREEVESRMRSQPSRGQWLAAADLVIPNHGSLAELPGTVDRVIPLLSHGVETAS